MIQCIRVLILVTLFYYICISYNLGARGTNTLRLVVIGLFARAVLDASILQLCLYILRYTAFYPYCVQSSYVFCCGTLHVNRLYSENSRNAHVLCHLATQLFSGSMTDITPSKYVVVHEAILSELPFIY